MPEVLTEYKPPDNGTVKFCTGCGRNDRFTVLRERHFAGGALCEGQIVTLEYALTNPERSRLEREVIEASKAIRAAAKKSYAMPTTEYREVVERFNNATDALIEFEANQQQIKKWGTKCQNLI